MGSWYENLKVLPKPNSITIVPHGTKTKVILHYRGAIKDKELIIDEEIYIDLDRANLEIESGEKWGDWGGPILCGSVLSIHKPNNKKDLSKVKVSYT